MEARELGIKTRPVLVGPITMLLLGKSVDGVAPLTLLPRMLDAYSEVLAALQDAGAEWVQIDEPFLVKDLAPEYVSAYRRAFDRMAASPLRVMLATYFGGAADNLMELLHGFARFGYPNAVGPGVLTVSTRRVCPRPRRWPIFCEWQRRC